MTTSDEAFRTAAWEAVRALKDAVEALEQHVPMHVHAHYDAMGRAARALAAMLAVHSLDKQSTARQYGSSLSPQEPHGRPQAPAGREEDSGPDR